MKVTATTLPRKSASATGLPSCEVNVNCGAAPITGSRVSPCASCTQSTLGTVSSANPKTTATPLILPLRGSLPLPARGERKGVGGTLGFFTLRPRATEPRERDRHRAIPCPARQGAANADGPAPDMQRRRPAVCVGMRICRNVEQSKISKGRVAKLRTDPAPAYRDRQAVGDFEPPERRHERTIFHDHFKDLAYRLGSFVRVNPRKRSRTVEHQAHGRPSSRYDFHSAHSKGPSLSFSVCSRIRLTAARACSRLTAFCGTRRATSLPWRVMMIS